MHGNRSGLQRSATTDNTRQPNIINSNTDTFGSDYAHGYEKSPYQSTPKKQHSSSFGETQNVYGGVNFHKTMLSKSGSSINQVFSSNQTNPALRSARSPSPSKSQLGSLSPTKITDMETSTVQRQRRELQLLMNELKDRDRELNEMVDSHQKQLIAWETDRKRVLVVENQLSKYKVDLKKKHEQLKSLKERLKMTEQSELSKAKELQTTQLHLRQTVDERNVFAQQIEELKDSNENMASSIQELSTSLGQLQAREQELITSLKLKENDIIEANTRLNDLAKKARSLQNSLQESRKNESAARNEKDQWKEQYLASKHEVEKLRSDINKQFNNADEHQAELSQIKQELLATQKELFLAGEREKRKDQLLELSKSKQERTETELYHLRQLYERQQRDYVFLQQQVQNQDNDTNDRLSEFNTDDGLSDISTIGKRNMDHIDDALTNLDNFNLQVSNRTFEMPDHNTDFLSSLYDNDIGKQGVSQNRTSASRSGRNLTELQSLIEHDQSQKRTVAGIDLASTNADNGSSPNDRLQKLLAESRQMVENLDSNSPLSSVHTSPEIKDMRSRSTEESFQPTTLVNKLSPIKINSFEEEIE